MYAYYKKALFLGVIFAFLVMGFLSMERAMPAHKENRIYNELKVYMPYILEKKVGGFAIIDKRTETKESPSAAEVMLRLDELEQLWGVEHLKIEDNMLLVNDNENKTIAKLPIQSQEERIFLEDFFSLR